MSARSVLFLFLPIGAIALIACTASSVSPEGHDENNVIRPNGEVVGGLAFNLWTCKELECMNLETSETSLHTYTACAAVLEDAQIVGVSLCESRSLKRTSVVSSPALCEPTGQPCPPNDRRAAYNWDEAVSSGRLKQDGGTDASADAKSDAGDGG